MVARALRLLWLLVLFAPATAAATPVFEPGQGVPPYYRGALYRYTVYARSEPQPITEVEVNLRGYLQLVNVYGPNHEGLLSGNNAECDVPGNLPFDEIGSPCSGVTGGCVDQISVVASDVGGEQLVTLAPLVALTDFPTFQIEVRYCGLNSCSPPPAPPQATFRKPPFLPAVLSDLDAPDACSVGLDLMVATPATVSAPRRNSPQAATITLSGLIGGTPAVVNADTDVLAALTCTSPGGSAGACSADPNFTVTVSQTAPVQLAVTTLNQTNPPGGDASIQVEPNLLLDLPAGTLASLNIPVEVEQAADQLEVEVNGAPPPAPVVAGAGDSFQLDVVSVLNEFGGNEPFVAAWLVDGATFDDATPDPDTSVWLQHVPPTSATLAVPADVFDNGGAVLTLTLSARHANPDGSSTRRAVTIRVEGEPPDPPEYSCRIVRERDQVSLGNTVGLALERVNQDTGAVETIAPDAWSVEPTYGSVEESAATATFPYRYRPPEELPSETMITIGAESSDCPSDPASVTVRLRDRLTLELFAEPAEVMPGGVVRLRAEVSSAAADVRQRLRFVADLGPGLKRLRKVAFAGQNVVTRPLEQAPEEGTALAFSFDLLGEGTAELSIPVMARAAFAGTAGRISARVYYAAGDAYQTAPVAEAAAQVRILEDPEFSESTLVGRVFRDKNGDGVQQEGEPGLEGVMVALATGIYALTDEHGKYHIARLAPGRHAVKVNVGTLPMGAELTTDELRSITLTPGVLTKVSFGVHTPDLEAREPLTLTPESGLVLGDNGPVFRAHFSGVVGPGLVARMLEQQRVVATEDGRATIDVPLKGGVWTLVERATDGRMYFWSFAVHTYPRDEGGTLVVPWGPRLVVRMVLPPPGRRVSAPELVLIGEAASAASVEISSERGGGCQLELGAGDELRCDLDPGTGLDELVVRVDPGPDAHGVDGPRQPIQVPVAVAASSHFLVGHLDLEVGLDFGSDDLLWPDGGGAFLYKGRLASGWELTAGADARVRELFFDNESRTFFQEVLWHDRTRVFRDLDPEEVYPAYGDSSRTVDERESGGRFFLRAQKDDSYVKWGGINTAIDDAEIGRFVRSLYGLGGVLDLGDDDLSVKARAFVAQPDTVAARDELTVTGGSLYFLGHKRVVEGSLRVTLELLDEISGLPVRATPLTEGSDYEADYAGGRIVLDSALPYRAFGSRLTSDGSGGRRGRLLVEYEYLGDSNSDWTFGGKVIGTWGPVSLGATGVTELAGLVDDNAHVRSRYWLAGGNLRLELGEPLRVRVEAAHSAGGGVDAGRSVDGGLTYSSRVSAGGQSGNAVSMELATGVESAEAGLYGRYVEPGFSDTHTAPGRRLVQGGLRVDADLASGTRLWGNYDHRETRLREVGLLSNPAGANTRLVVRDLGLLGAAQRLGSVELSVEGRYESLPKDERRRALIGAQVNYRLLDGIELSVRRRQVVDADGVTRKQSSMGESSLGALLETDGGFRLASEVGTSDDAELFGRAQATLPVAGDTELYAGYQVASRLGLGLAPLEGEQGSRVVAGGRRDADDGTVLYSEQALAMDGSERLLSRTVGATVPVADRVQLSLSYERGSLDRDDLLIATNRVRDAVAVGAGYSGERLSARLSADGRLDRGAARDAALAASGRVDFRATDDLTLAVAGRGGGGYTGDELATTRQAWEGALGFALRPVASDRLSLFGRYALVYERDRLAGDGPWLRSTSHVLAAALLYDVWGPFAISPKVAYRNTFVSGPGVRGTDQALLAALRGDLHLTRSWDATLEGRTCAAPGANTDPRFGALAEVSMLILEWLRLGGGYNFSSISASGVQCEEPGARGLFLRAEAIY